MGPKLFQVLTLQKMPGEDATVDKMGYAFARFFMILFGIVFLPTLRIFSFMIAVFSFIMIGRLVGFALCARTGAPAQERAVAQVNLAANILLLLITAGLVCLTANWFYTTRNLQYLFEMLLAALALSFASLAFGWRKTAGWFDIILVVVSLILSWRLRVPQFLGPAFLSAILAWALLLRKRDSRLGPNLSSSST
jgi:hypothetical protein